MREGLRGGWMDEVDGKMDEGRMEWGMGGWIEEKTDGRMRGTKR